MRGHKKNLNYLLEGGPLVVQASLTIHLYHCTSWPCCERLHSASVNFFWRLFQHICLFHDGGFTIVPAHTVPRAQQFLTKTGMAPVPHPPHSPLLTPNNTFFVLSDVKSPQREMLCQCGRGETKNSRSTKRHQNWWVQNCFEQWEKVLIGVLHQMESTLKVTEV